MNQVQTNSTQKLEAAFEIFNRMSDSLGDSYRELEARVSELSSELAEERSEKFRELAAKERLANRLSTLLAVLPGGVIVLDSVDRVSEANPEAMELLGSDILGDSWAHVMETRVKPRTEKHNDIELNSGKYVSISERVLDAEGNQVILLTDVTEAHETQEWVNRETRLSALGEMSARLAHQLRTPLSSALLYVSHLSFTDVDEADRIEIGRKITDRLKHLEELIEGMLGYVRGEERAQSKFSLTGLVDEFESVITGKAELKCGAVSVQCKFNETKIRGDRQALLSALINIAENAIELIPAPFLDVMVAVEGKWVDIFIRDNGPGIDPSIMKSIFDPFYTTRTGGTGLGLAIADITAREHGGYIEVDNMPDDGAVFHVRVLVESLSPGLARLPANIPEQFQVGEEV